MVEHAVAVACPSSVENVPIGQGVGKVEFAGQKALAGQLAGSDDPGAQKNVEGHSEQAVKALAFAVDEKVPVGHGAGAVEFSGHT